jgi:hypothetical protein
MFDFFLRFRAYRTAADILEEVFRGARIPAPLTELLVRFYRKPTQANADAVIGYHSGFDVFFRSARLSRVRGQEQQERQGLRVYAKALRRLIEAEDAEDTALARLRQTNAEARARLQSLTTEEGRQTAPARCTCGRPSDLVALAPEWRTDTVVALACQMDESRDFSAMPILADALQDAGCDNDDILTHCRDTSATHAHGCWVVDLVLGKE